MNDLISIVVPIYNVEKYLEKCIDSLVKQTYRNIEVLLIDDGSTDNSGKICDKYQNNDNRIKVFHKENGGLSDARNYGIEKASGKYICFIDSDDYIDLDTIQLLYEGCIKNNLEIACCGKYLEDENGKYIIINSPNDKICYSVTEALKNMFITKNIDTSSCDKLFKKTLFNGISFPKGRYYEDLGTIYKVIYKANGVFHIGKPKYHYINRSGSITKSKFNLKHLDSIYFAKEVCKFFENKNADIYESARSLYFLTLNNVLQDFYIKKAKKKYKNEYIKIKKEFNSNFVSMLKNKYIKFNKKLMLTLIFLNLNKLIVIIKKIRNSLRKRA